MSSPVITETRLPGAAHSPPVSPYSWGASGRLFASKAHLKDGKVSRNVIVCLVMCVFWGLSESIWSGTILAAWLYGLSGNKDSANTVVGFVEAAGGFSELVTAFPVGYLADKYGRSPVIRLGGLGFVSASMMTLYAVYAEVSPHQGLVLLTVAMCVWGFSGGIFNGPVQALFAESVPEGDRSYWYSMLSLSWMLPSVVGPAISIVLFKVYGDKWTLSEIRPIFVTGVLLELVPACLSFFMRDDLALPENCEEHMPLNSSNSNTEIGDLQENDKQGEYNFCGTKITPASIPYLLFLADVLTSLGSGMTVKFFPLFFKNSIMLSPSATQGIYMILPVMMAGFTLLSQRISLFIGRVQTILLSRGIAVLLLLLMTYLVDRNVTKWYIIVPLYLFRSAIANCSYPLDESLLMDNVSKETRARWKTLESISVFGWCGSAFIGGVLADRFSYNFTFLITAFLQAAAVIPTVLILPVVKPEKNADEDYSRDSLRAEVPEVLSEPLLQRVQNFESND